MLSDGGFNSLPKDKSTDLPKLRSFGDQEIIVVQMIIFVFGRVINMMVKAENPGYQHIYAPTK